MRWLCCRVRLCKNIVNVRNEVALPLVHNRIVLLFISTGQMNSFKDEPEKDWKCLRKHCAVSHQIHCVSYQKHCVSHHLHSWWGILMHDLNACLSMATFSSLFFKQGYCWLPFCVNVAEHTVFQCVKTTSFAWETLLKKEGAVDTVHYNRKIIKSK